MELPTVTNEYGCLVLDNAYILAILPKDTPLVLFLHGGAMTIGSPRMSEGLELLVAALKEESSTVKASKAPVAIYASVDYSLAPEHPFPVAPSEVCSVVSHVLDLKYTQLHIMGVSAGGYLALVAGLEAFRGASHHQANKARNSIVSIVAACPMLSPATNSVSFYQNSASSHFCPVHFLRWSYRAYLELPDNDSKEEKTSTGDHDESNLSDIFGRNSTEVAWSQSKWYSSKWRRLVEPKVNLPDNMEHGPRIILTTNKADPLHEDGVAMYEALKAAGARISHHDDRGSHWFGTRSDKLAYRNLTVALKNVIFHGDAE